MGFEVLEMLLRNKSRMLKDRGDNSGLPLADEEYFRNELEILNAMDLPEAFEAYARSQFLCLEPVVAQLSSAEHRRVFCVLALSMCRSITLGRIELDVLDGGSDALKDTVSIKGTNSNIEVVSTESSGEEMHRVLLDLFTRKERHPERLAVDLVKKGEPWHSAERNLQLIESFLQVMDRDDSNYVVEKFFDGKFGLERRSDDEEF
jgi:hypothetical protein